MLTTKNRVRTWRAGILIASVVGWWCGCTPAGPKALLEGERLLNAGQVEQAVQRLERAVRLIPENAQAWNHLGLAYHRAGRLDHATQAYQRSLSINSGLVAPRFNLGCLSLERGDSERAIRELSAFLAVQPQSTAGWLKLGTAQLRARHTEGAEQSFRQAIRLDERSPEGFNGLGLVQVQRRRYPEAYQQFQAATQVQRDYAPALRNAAIVAHQYLKNQPVALQRYRELLALPNLPDREFVETLAVRIENELTRAPKPQPQITQTTNEVKAAPSRGTESKSPQVPSGSPPTAATAGAGLSPTNNKAASSVGSLAARTNPPPQPKVLTPTNKPPSTATPGDAEPDKMQQRPAQEAQVQPVERAPRVSEPEVEALSPFPRYRYLASGKPVKGDRAAAATAFAEGYEAHTRYRYSEAISDYQRAIRSDPSFFDAHYNLGVAAFENGDLPLALSAYESALAIEGDSLKARFNFASTLEQAGFLQDAADELEKLVVLHDSQVRIHAALANLYARKLGDSKRARPHYLRVLELDPRYPDATAIRYWLESNR